jgi:HTH-type transcriptional regulator/antitoxin HigA
VEAMTAMRKLWDDYVWLVKRFPLRLIRNDAEYLEAMKILAELGIKDHAMRPGERDYYDVLSTLIGKYEDMMLPHHRQGTPQEILKHLMEEHDLRQVDLVPLVGQKSHLSAFLNGKRNLSKAQAIQLARHFNVCPTLFLPRLTDNVRKGA